LRIALLEDDTHVGQLLSLWLEAAGYECDLYATGEAFHKAVSRESYDLLILDWMLPDTSGDQVLVRVRARVDARVPVIFVTALDAEESIVAGLNLGADDYIVKPVRQGEFLARVNAVLRRAQGMQEPSGMLDAAPYRFNLAAHTLSRDGKEVALTQMEFELALFLFRNVGRLLSRAHLLDAVWGKSSELSSRTLDTHISKLRNKLDLPSENSWKLSAVYNHGYRLERTSVV